MHPQGAASKLQTPNCDGTCSIVVAPEIKRDGNTLEKANLCKSLKKQTNNIKQTTPQMHPFTQMTYIFIVQN